MDVPRKDKPYEKYAWIIFVILPIVGFFGEALHGLFSGISPDTDALQGLTGTTRTQLVASDPQVARYVGLISVRYYIELSFGILIIAIAVRGFRRGEKWAWYALWVLPSTSVLISVDTSLRLGTTTIVGFTIPILAIILLGLFLPYRKFFPKKPVIGAAPA